MGTQKRGADRPSELLRETLFLKKTRALPGNSATSEVYNRFDALSDITLSGDELDCEVTANSAPKTTVPKKVKIPPIVFPNLDRGTIEAALKSEEISDYNLKLMSSGKKLVLSDIENFNRFREYLISKKVLFYTHQRADTKPTKIVLSGLHSMEVDDLKSHLIKLQLKVTDVKKFNFATKIYANHATYLVYFEHGSIKVADLRKNHKHIMHTIVHWSYYKNKRNGPTQCRNCQMFGHGSSNCYLPKKCLICAQEHSHTDCPEKDKEKIKCANCGKNHLANDEKCGHLREYISKKTKANYRNRNRTNNVKFNPVFTNDDYNFPAFRGQRNQPMQNQRPGSRPSYSSALRNNNSSRRSSIATDATNNSNHHTGMNANGELFTAEELLKLSTELINNLYKCRNKSEQFKVIVDLATKFVYG